jgi:hypothetical protein
MRLGGDKGMEWRDDEAEGTAGSSEWNVTRCG